MTHDANTRHGASGRHNPQSPVISWADSVLNSLTADQRIGQLFMVAAYSNNKKDMEQIKKLIDSCGIGGLIFFQGGPSGQASLTNYYQSISKVKLLIAMDAEWGLNMRLDSTVAFPLQMTLGAIPYAADSLIYLMGKEIARQCKRLGIHINLAPVVDINNNSLNPVIGMRSFGEDKFTVARKSLLYMKGMQDAGILACAKHFPGHGDTESDSHKTLPAISHSKETIDTLDLFPFRELIRQGLAGVMVAHLYIPALDTAVNIASTLSPKIVTGLLKNELKFDGLVFTDALNMKGVSKFFRPGEVDVKAILAGNDILLFSEDVPKAIAEIKQAMVRGEITQEEIDSRCKKILMAKYWAGLNKYLPVDTVNLIQDLNSSYAEFLNVLLAENSLTLLKNESRIIPLLALDTLRIVSVAVGQNGANEFQKMLGRYASVTNFSIGKNFQKAEADSLVKKISNFIRGSGYPNLVIVSVVGNNIPQKDFGLSSGMIQLIKRISKNQKIILSVFASPYSLALFDSLENIPVILLGYENNDELMRMAAQMIFGGISAKGKLPVTVSKFFPLSSGIKTPAPVRFKYTVPEDVGIDSKKLSSIDSIVTNAIAEKVFPGAVVLFAKDRKVFYYKAFGYHTYENRSSVKKDDIYDLASITKIAATTAAVMKLTDKKKIGLDDYLCYHLPELEGTDKMNIQIRDVLTHQAGLRDWIPFFLKTMSRGEYKSGIYSRRKSSDFPVRVAEKMYINKNYRDTIWKQIIESPLYPKREYKYSDLGFLMMWKIVEHETNTTMNEYVLKNFYRPLGLSTMGFLPRERFSLSRIIPTEYDVKFRKQLIHGDVHDPAAAMLGGVAGHAGLFSDASDLGIMMQMFLQKGEYGGRRYLDSATVKEFTRCQFCPDNRRGLGFDKPEKNPQKENNICECVSASGFGHQGFTGTVTWVDPEKNLVYVFLSNRVYPDAENNKITKTGIRSALLRVIYEAMKQ